MGNLERALGEENSISDIRRYFEEGATPLQPSEFTEFWKGLSEEEKIEFKKMDLSQTK